MELTAFERGMTLRNRLLHPITQYMETVEFLNIDVQDFETLQNMPELELNRLRVLLPFLRATIRVAMHNGGISTSGVSSAKSTLMQAITSGWCHKILRPKANLLTTTDAVVLCRELGDTAHQAVKQARVYQRAGALTMSDTMQDGRVRYLCPTLSTVTRMLETCIYWNVVRMLESESVGGPAVFKLPEAPRSSDDAAYEMVDACRAAYNSVYGDISPEDRTILGSFEVRAEPAKMSVVA